MNTRFAIGTGVLALQLLAGDAVAQEAAGPSHVTSPTTAVDLVDGVDQLSIPVRVDPQWKLTGVEVIGVGRGARRDAGLSRAVEAKSPTNSTFTLEPKHYLLRAPGAYQVTVLSTATGPAGEDKKEPTVTGRIELTLIRHKPELQLPASVHIDVTRWPLGRDSVTVTPLTLAETGRLTGATNVVLQQRGTALTEGSKPSPGMVTGALEKDADGKPAVNLAAGHRTTAQLQQTGFDLGSASGTLALYAPELDTAVLIPYSIRCHWSEYLVFVVFLVGGVMGHVVRRLAPDAEKHARLAQEGDRRITALQALAESSRSSEQSKLAEMAGAIRSAASTSDTELEKRLTEAEELMRRVVADHQTALTTAASRLNDLSRVEVLRALPSAVAQRLEALPVALARVEKAIARANVVDAEASVGHAEQTVDAAAREAGDAVEPLRGASHDLASIKDHSPSTLDPAWSDLSAAITGLEAVRNMSAVTSSVQLLVELDGAVRRLHDFVGAAVRGLDRLARDAKSKLVKSPDLARQIVDAARVPPALDPTAQLQSVLGALESVHAVVQKRITSLDDRGIEAQEHLKARDYLACFEELDRASDAKQGGTEDIEIKPNVVPVAPAASSERRTAPEANASARLPLFDRRMGERLKLLRVIQLVVTFLALPAAACALYGPSFIGEWREVFAILATGFMTDFSTDAALAAIDRLKKS